MKSGILCLLTVLPLLQLRSSAAEELPHTLRQSRSRVRFEIEDVNHRVPVYNSLSDRLDAYCQPPFQGEEGDIQQVVTPYLLDTETSTAGIEASGRSNATLELSAVWAVLRHGDRTGFGQIEGTDEVSWDCDFGEDNTLPPRAHTEYHAEYVSPEAVAGGLDCSRDVAPKQCSPGKHGNQHLEAANAARGFRVTETVDSEHPTKCRHGMLTKEGIRQHTELGRLFQQKYGSIFQREEDGRINAEQVYCSSTDYPRTALSAASFLEGLQMSAFNFTIYVQPREKDPALVQELVRKCNKFQSDVDEHTYHFSRFNQLPIDLAKKVSRITNCEQPDIDASLRAMKQHDRDILNGATFPGYAGGLQKPNPLQGKTRCSSLSMDATLFGDIVVTRQCHSLPLPCRTQNGLKSTCMDEEIALKAVEQADRDYARRYSGEPNEFLIYPLLSQLSAQMQTHVDCVKDFSNCKRLWLLFAHDITVYPLTSALNITDYKWPSYAARVVFELFESKGAPNKYIRVMYQGGDKTKKLSCSEQHRVILANGSDSLAHLCPLREFFQLLDNIIYDGEHFNLWQEGCSFD